MTKNENPAAHGNLAARTKIFRSAVAISVGAIAAIAGCSAPPPTQSRVPVPRTPDEGPPKTYAPLRPLREVSMDEQLPPPAFDDAPLVTQALPEQPAYVAAYERVGRPRMAVFVNRTIDGQIMPIEERRAVARVEVTRESNAAVEVGTTRESYGWYSQQQSNRFKSDGPARLQETAAVYLAPGEYDDAQAKSIDYAAIELALADALSAGGKVTLVNPSMARERLSDEEVKDLQSGRPTMLREIAEKLDVDVLVQAQARPTKQTASGLEVRVLVEAINTRGGESVARAAADMKPPLEKTTINRFTRFLARKTMAELANNWTTMANDPPRGEKRETTDERRPNDGWQDNESPRPDPDLAAPTTRPQSQPPSPLRPTTQPREPSMLQPQLESPRPNVELQREARAPAPVPTTAPAATPAPTTQRMAPVGMVAPSTQPY